MSEHLQLGTARVDITPGQPVPLAGFSFRTGAFEGVHSRLFLRALLLSQRVNGSVSRAVLLSADLFCWGPELTDPVCKRISERLGIPFQAVILHATHNHSGPQTSSRFAPSLGLPSKQYLDFLTSAAVEAAASAAAGLEPVEIDRGRGTFRLGINRRLAREGAIRMAPNPDGPSDSDVNVIRFRTPAGRTKALLVHYACHPTVSAVNQVCAEYAGVAMAQLEEDSAPVAAFLQGCCADIRPAVIRDGEFYRAAPEDALAAGRELGAEVSRVLVACMQPCSPGVLSVATGRTPLPLGLAPTLEEIARLEGETDIVGEWSRMLLAHPAALAWAPALESTRLDLAAGVGLLTFNAEMGAAYGLYTKQISAGGLLPVGYTNGMIGYIPTRRQVSEGGYESAEAFRYYGYPAPFAGAVEDDVLRHIRQLTRAVGPVPCSLY